MAKLLPPIVENITPAFYDKDGMVFITIPFFMNRAVNPEAIHGIAIKIKSVQSNVSLYETTTTEFNIESSSGQAILKISKNSEATKNIINILKIGQFYKFQIAYINENEIGYYSSATTSKYTTKPTLEIKELDRDTISPRGYYYTGIYSQKGKDITEALHSYSFNVYDSYRNLIYTTDWQLYNNENVEEIYESSISFKFDIQLEENAIYFIEYNIKTINGLESTSFSYQITERPTLDPEIKASLTMSLDKEDGFIQINLIADRDRDGNEYPATGSFVLTRACLDSNNIVWDQLATFNFLNEIPTRVLFKDFTIEQGKRYQYGLQQFNCRNLYSNRMLATNDDKNEIRADFEHAFLYDGQRQLKIKYNPKVSSLKGHILETKVDTIGGQYPFIFKNGNVNYKEFPISGLISLLSDENSYFLSSPLKEYSRPGTPAAVSANYKEPLETPTFPTLDNFYNERNFKLEVLEWLNDGQPKLFRSASEGNYIIRVMNTSLTPNDQLGRMLHTFNTTAYEIATFDYHNLVKYGFLNIVDNYSTKSVSWKTIAINNDTPLNENLMDEDLALTIDCYDMMYGDKIKLTLEDGTEVPIFIGLTGRYRVDLEIPIKSIQLIQRPRKEENKTTVGYITYSFYTVINNEFKLIKDISYTNIPATQIIGDISRRIEDNNGFVSYESVSLLKHLGFILEVTDKVSGQKKFVLNPKKELLKIYYLKGSRRPWKPLYITFKDAGHQRQLYWLNPATGLKLIKPDASVLYRGINGAKADGITRISLSEYLDGPKEEDYFDVFNNGAYKDYAYLDFHKNYYTEYYFDESEVDSSNTVGNISRKFYENYEPYFNYQTFNDHEKTSEEKIDLAAWRESSYVTLNFNSIKDFNFQEKENTFQELKTFNDIETKNGVILELGYFARNIDYLIEHNISDIEYRSALQQLEKYLANGAQDINNSVGLDYNSDIYYRLINEVNSQYHDYCVKVYEALEEIYNKEKEELTDET